MTLNINRQSFIKMAGMLAANALANPNKTTEAILDECCKLNKSVFPNTVDSVRAGSFVEQIKQICIDHVGTNTEESRNSLKQKLEDVAKNFNIPKFNVVCDERNNPPSQIVSQKIRVNIYVRSFPDESHILKSEEDYGGVLVYEIELASGEKGETSCVS